MVAGEPVFYEGHSAGVVPVLEVGVGHGMRPVGGLVAQIHGPLGEVFSGVELTGLRVGPAVESEEPPVFAIVGGELIA